MKSFFSQSQLNTYRLAMPRKHVLVNGIAATTSPALPAQKRKASKKQVSETKRKARSPTLDPIKRAISTATVLEDPTDRDASPDARESENPDLHSSDQAVQPRQPAVNSTVLPLPWKGRLGYAFS